MDLATFQVKIIDYAMENIIPNLPTVPINILGFNIPVSPSLMQFGAGVGLTMSTFNIEKYAPQLKAFGVLSEANTVDISKLTTALTEQIQKVKVLQVGDFNFDETDVAKFVAYLKS